MADEVSWLTPLCVSMCSTAIRVVEGGSAAMTSLDIVKGGKHFVSGGADKMINVSYSCTTTYRMNRPSRELQEWTVELIVYDLMRRPCSCA